MFLQPALAASPAPVPVTARAAAVVVGALAGGTSAERRQVLALHPGGLVVFHELAAGGRAFRLQLRRSGARPVVMVDQEGGSVRRVPALGPRAAPVLGAGARTVTRREFRATAIGLRALGVDVDLAPVVDVARGGATTGRSFGSAPTRVGAHAAAALGGLGAGGVAGCLKHFPGLGAVALSTDDGVAIDARSRVAVLADLAAFARPIRAGARCVMVSSVIVPALCVRPAMLCPQTYRRLRAMGFRGAIITDSLDAAALRTYGAPAALAVAVLAAGADAAMTTSAGSSIGAVAAIRQAIADHRLRAGRVAASARRLARLR